MLNNQQRTLHLIAHDIRSRENAGSIFRTCEFLGVSKLWLTGYTPAPPDPKLLKVSLGAEKSIEWEKVDDIAEVMSRVKEEGFRIVALEITGDAKDIAEYRKPTRAALVIGNEVSGISPTLLKKCDDVIMIAKKGKKESLNVSVAAGIACWSLLN
ncbi:TrmH family RNA methyltransferase [Patescibacteria group bacterium]|nr:TrmH family RNA methyltransferase [Patescibacteria group bacterium]MBU1034644.1 TrmH family RNA methyltransferase [Patescibacteria group bacterium]MBU1629668.1 TrmH family RNA methyltransferase [Patescibacteria group bacterium]MBU1908304.1 TrmH family RNA methyltransferase [Patescibacteria group bacterium]